MPGGGHAATMVTGADKAVTMMLLGFWLLAGLALGMILMAFLAIGAYQRGYEAGYLGRKSWQTELEARRRAFAKAYDRGAHAAPPRVMSPRVGVEIPPGVAAAS